MKVFIISLATSLFFNVLCNTSLIGHFSLFYLQVMILFVIEEVHLRWEERFQYWEEHKLSEDCEPAKLYFALYTKEPKLRLDITELGFILVPEDIFDTETSPVMVTPYMFQQYQQDWNDSKHEDIGLAWLVARGYTADKLDELKEDMPRILAYLRNVQTAKAIDAL